MSAAKPTTTGIVTIGRNEGDRLKRCLRSVLGRVEHVIYVDSGSVDGSVEFARSMGVEVVELDMTRPFTMARGRNAGFERLMTLDENVQYIQFVDGDCEVADGWIETARRTLDERADVVAVCGRRRERYPEASKYNQLADMEWDRPPGEVAACGGDVMMRCAALRQVGAFNPGMIAGEEPELCFRLRDAGGRILRLPDEMTLHDAAMTRFGQWWKRTVRTGHAYAEGAWLHGRSPERYNVRQVVSAMLWGLIVPLMIIGAAVAAAGGLMAAWILVFILLAGYVRLVWRVRRRNIAEGYEPRLASMATGFMLLSKPAHVVGILRFVLNRLLRRQSTLIEYKGPDDLSVAGSGSGEDR